MYLWNGVNNFGFLSIVRCKCFFFLFQFIFGELCVFREMNRSAGRPCSRINTVFSHLTVLRAGDYYVYHVVNISQHLIILRFATRYVTFLRINVYE